MIAIFDIDSLIYEACYGAEDFDDATESFWSRYNDAEYNLQMKYSKVEMIPVGFCRNNYRKVVDSNYKMNRAGNPKPEHFDELIQHVKDNLDVQMRRGIETDDLVAKFHKHIGSDKSVIVSVDKDYKQFEGTMFNYRKKEFDYTSKEEALYNFWEQMVIGDRADNVLVCKGYGVKWCEKNLKGLSEFGMMRVVLSLYKELYKSKGREKLIKTYLLLKLDVF